MPSSTGRNRSASSGSVRLDASKMRRNTPQPPPDRCCTIISAIEPRAMPRKSRCAMSHDRKKWSRSKTKPMAQTTSPATPTISARERGTSMSATGGV
jgi:hypothetical protein